uniref:Transposase n=1 Tax=Heterorhabditis bacteriophora TaxID=37862 RepID=A0A1I7WI12_HETBA
MKEEKETRYRNKMMEYHDRKAIDRKLTIISKKVISL